MELSRRAFVLTGAAAPLAGQPWFRRHLRDDHDADLPAWGPYTNRYIGISHVADQRRGLRFDLGVFPGYYRRKVTIPHARWESDFHPWEASPDLEYYSFRHQLEWKDRVYCDASYSAISPHASLIRCECVNSTARPQNLVLNYIGSLEYPGPRYEMQVPEGAVALAALDYVDLRFARQRPQDNLNYDGLLRGEALGGDFTGGSGVGRGFGADRGDSIDYRAVLPAEIRDAVLLVRCRAAKGLTARLAFRPLAGGTAIEGTGEFRLVTVPCGTLPAGEHAFRLESEGGAAIELDTLVFSPASAADRVVFRAEQQDVHPEAIGPGPRKNSLVLKYRALDRWYGIAWNHPRSQVRQYICAELDNFFRYRVQDHVSLVQKGPGDGHFTNVFLRPIPIAPRSSAVLHGMVCDGSRAEVERMLGEFPAASEACERSWAAARARRVEIGGRPEGRAHEFSQRRLAACSLTNVMYPVYLKRHYIKHTTPGRFWHMLYTWDAGFTALGLLEVDPGRALGLLNTYLTAPGDPHAAFIHHGTPIPVQIYLFHEIWNRTRSRELLEHYYPRLRQFHMFLAGRLGSSTTRRLASQLIQTWDYFYNTGWDDYPPQMYMHQNKLQKSLAAPTPTAHAIRTSRLLGMMAAALGEEGDAKIYRDDVAAWTESLQRWSWDPESGYFGYVRHDAEGRPQGILRHESGKNFNMGMCGAYPLLAGICTPEQEARILGHMMSPGHLWTPIGMTTVDRSAPYYLGDGYWNGAVWFPHQWFAWKAMLDLGRGEEAWRIASTALDVWRREVDDSYGCFEHFMVDSGRGAGWHHFTSLSAPQLGWYSSYYRPGWLTTGFDAWVEECRFGRDHRTLDARLRMTGQPGREALVLCVMAPAPSYAVTVDGKPARFRALPSGALEIRIPNEGVHRLQIA